MPIHRESPRTTVTTTFICERCHTEAVVVEEIETTEPHEVMPDKWRRILVGISLVAQDPMTTDLVFCQRACMSTWLGEFVRRVYGEDVENKPARVSRKRVRKQVDVAHDEPTLLESPVEP